MSSPLVSWCQKELSKLLDIETSEDIVRYILNIQDAKELEDYLLELLNPDDPDHVNFIQELLKKWNPREDKNVTVYQKEKEQEVFFAGTRPKDKTKKKVKPEKRDDDENSATPTFPNASSTVSPQSGARKKTKYVELYSPEGEARQEVRLPGRHACECQASKHRLINNCLKCGRIVCEQEGSGPCFFCGNLVCTQQEREFMNQGTKKAEQLRRKLLNDHPPDKEASPTPLSTVSPLPGQEARMSEGLTKAQAHRDRLLEYDKTHTKRTQVIDDESDYYASGADSWLNRKEKQALQKKEEEMREKRFGSRMHRKITFDFAGRQIIDAEDDSASLQMYLGEQGSKVEASSMEASLRTNDLLLKMMDQNDRDLVNPFILTPAPTFVGGVESGEIRDERMTVLTKKEPAVKRLQDRELMQLRDDGFCLSMHQPWASMLVRGIKKHEGRSWYSAHRGRLWIASTAKPPSGPEIVTLETEYRRLYDCDLEFPRDYPTGVLLGCVDVVDVLSQDEYALRFNGPDADHPAESQSPFVFVCENPQELFVKFPIKGQHKIYKLEPHVHQAAKKGARLVDAPSYGVFVETDSLHQNFGCLRIDSREQIDAAA